MAGNESVTIEDIDGISSLCTGCGACAAAYPTGSICMTTDREGFSYPRVDNNQCIACHKCLNVCQASRDSAKQNRLKSKRYMPPEKTKEPLDHLAESWVY